MPARQSAATGVLALQALVTFTIDNGLPTPATITLPTQGFPHLEVWLTTPAATPWLDAPGVQIRGEQTIPTFARGDFREEYESVHTDATIPSALGEVRVVFRYIRRALPPVAPSLHVVQGAS